MHPYPAYHPKPSKVSLGTDASAKRLSVLGTFLPILAIRTLPSHCAYLRVLTTVDAKNPRCRTSLRPNKLLPLSCPSLVREAREDISCHLQPWLRRIRPHTNKACRLSPASPMACCRQIPLSNIRMATSLRANTFAILVRGHSPIASVSVFCFSFFLSSSRLSSCYLLLRLVMSIYLTLRYLLLLTVVADLERIVQATLAMP